MSPLKRTVLPLALASLAYGIPHLEERTLDPVCVQIASAISSASDVYYPCMAL
jgi:hypothetical protein